MTQYTLFAEEPHPAIALYRFWRQVLDFTERKVIAFGAPGWGLTIGASDDHIHYGRFGGYSVDCHFTLAPDGRFRWGTMYGVVRRREIALAVPFLAWGFTHARYQWFVDFDRVRKERGWWNGGYNLTDFQEPRHYVSEDLLGCRVWRQTARWCTLERFPGEWRIMPATAGPWRSTSDRDEACEDWDRYELVIGRRYQKSENHFRIANGLDPKLSARTPTLRAGGKVLSTDQSVDRLLALLETEQPAKNHPLKRPKEAAHGIDNLVPTNCP